MKYLIYLRVSTDKQDVETQERMCLDYIKSKEGNHTYHIFSDPDMSSGIALDKRTGLQEMFKAIRSGYTVLVYKLDRISRDVVEMVNIYRMITRLKANVVSLNDPYSDEFSVGLMGLIAQRERDTIRKRTKDKLATKKEKNERYSGHIPYGYKLHETQLVPIKVGDEIVMKPGVIVPLSEEQEVLARMYQYFDEGKSYQQIASSLNNSGYKNRVGKPFQKMSIYRILFRTGRTKSSDQPQEEKEVHQFHSL